MSQIAERPYKVAKMLRQKGQEFLQSPRNYQCLEEILSHFKSGQDQSPCILTMELIFTNLLKDKLMYDEVIPLTLRKTTPESKHKEYLKKLYEECWELLLNSIGSANHKIGVQAFATAIKIMSYEGRFPIENKGNLNSYVPLNRLKSILMKCFVTNNSTIHLSDKYEEYIMYDDILFYTWKLLPVLTFRHGPNETYIMNYLNLFGKLQVERNKEFQLLCCDSSFNYDDNLVVKNVNKCWNIVMQWEHSQRTHKMLLVVLLKLVLPHLEKPLLMTDFLMDSLDIGGAVGLLALQGIFTMIQVHNLDYPNIFVKLYSMFEPEIFHTKFKSRLFYLANMFLSSTHLPESMVAAFAKRLSRLTLVAPTEDIVIICMFIGNLILRHPGLKWLINHPKGGHANQDPYIMDERDPVKSRAMESSLWEIQTLQHHAIPKVAIAARFINNPLPSVEWDISEHLDDTGDDLFDKEIKRNPRLFALAFERPSSHFLNKGDVTQQFWNFE